MVRVRELAGVACVAFAAMATAMALQSQHAGLAWPPSNPAAHVANQVAPKQKLVRVAQALIPQDQSVDVAARVRDSVPGNLYPYFDMYLYVSKAEAGPWAQHMFIFHKDAGNQLAFEQSFPVSTGRERREKYFTTTPAGMFELDPNRFDRVHFSRRWHNAPMPWAMFWNYSVHGHMAGVAIHSGIGHVADLGRRASGGCIRLPPDMAEILFKRIQATERGRVPVFVTDPLLGNTSVTGQILLDANGNPVMTAGYRVLLIVQDYPGGPALLASLS